MEIELFRRAANSTKGATLGVTLRKREVKGDVGIEIEVEGKRLLHAEDEGERVLNGWRYHIDGSLRGEENAEYVSDGPIPFDKVPSEISKLFTALQENGAILDESNRTSVHVHLNCQPLFLNQFTAFAALYFIVEEILTEWCGDHRVGNLFCLRAKDAPGIVSNIERFIRNNGDWQFSEALHYAAFNPQALNKFGSIEIRTMRGETDPEVIVTWIAMLQRLYEYAKEVKDPRKIMEMFSGEGPLRFFDIVMGEYAQRLRRDLGLGDQFLRESLYEGVRLAQRLCYCRDWSKYETVSLDTDPFGRDPLKILNSINGGPASPQQAVPTSATSLQYNTYNLQGGVAYASDPWAFPAPTATTSPPVPDNLNTMSNAEFDAWLNGEDEVPL